MREREVFTAIRDCRLEFCDSFRITFRTDQNQSKIIVSRWPDTLKLKRLAGVCLRIFEHLFVLRRDAEIHMCRRIVGLQFQQGLISFRRLVPLLQQHVLRSEVV